MNAARAGLPGRAERAVIWLLCRLLPAGFRARQHAEWTGDLMALSASGAVARWRYLSAAAWTLPALRAHARRAGVDGPQPTVPPSVPVRTLARVLLAGIGVPVVSWLIVVPVRPATSDTGHELLPHPSGVWPTEGPLTALDALTVGAWVLVDGTLLLVWLGLVVAVLGSTQRQARWLHRAYAGALGLALLPLSLLTQLLLHQGVARRPHGRGSGYRARGRDRGRCRRQVEQSSGAHALGHGASRSYGARHFRLVPVYAGRGGEVRMAH